MRSLKSKVNVLEYLPLLKLLVNRDLTLRYKRSFIGVGWTLVNPMITSFVLWTIFSFVWASKLPGNQQFAPYLMAGVLLVNFFNQSVSLASESISNNSNVLTKVYVPPQIFPISTSIAGLLNFTIGLLPLSLVCFISGQKVSLTFPLVFFVGLSMVMLTSGIGLMLSVMYIRFDDMRNIINVLLMILMYFTPVFYPLSILQPKMQQIIMLNPLNSYLNIFRWAFSKNAETSLFDWIFMFSTAILSLSLGIYIFKKFWSRTVAML